MNDRRAYIEILGQIRNPLVFFGLVLLVIEAIFGLVVTNSQMSGTYQFYSVCIMAFLFLVVVGAVIYITIRHPRHLYEQIAEEMERSRYVREFINGPGFEDAVEEIIEKYVKEGHGKEVE